MSADKQHINNKIKRFVQSDDCNMTNLQTKHEMGQ